MRIIKRKRVIEESKRFPSDVQSAVAAWCKVVEQANWKSLNDIRNTYNRSVDRVGNFLVFNIKESYRLIVGFDFGAKIIFFKYFLTHEEYEDRKWKNDPYF